MSVVVNINSLYEKDRVLNNFVCGLPCSFNESGSLLWDGRNKIKLFDVSEAASEIPFRVVVKRFKRPNLIQTLGYAFRKHKARKSYENGVEMLRRGIDTPEPIGFVEFKNGPFMSEAYYMCKELEPSTEIKNVFERKEWDKYVAKAFGQYIAKLHKCGFLHNDFNNTNVLFTQKNGKFHFILIDINRVTFYNSIDEISMKDRIYNMTRFCGRLDLFAFVAKEYALECGIANTDEWIDYALSLKKKHDKNWILRKKMVHPLRTLRSFISRS